MENAKRSFFSVCHFTVCPHSRFVILANKCCLGGFIVIPPVNKVPSPQIYD